MTRLYFPHRAQKLIVSALALILLAVAPNVLLAAQQAAPQIPAPSAILMDASDGRVLWEKNARQRRPIASTTKIMTAIIALETLRGDDLVVTSQRASDAGESELYLSPGEQRKVEELIYGLLLRSANDAAVVLAEKAAGSVEAFARLMNEKAKAIGALDTNFTNPHGLKDGNHYSNAYDLALITHYALKNKKFATIVRTRSYVMEWPGNSFPRVCENHNQLLNMLPWATGVKTGYTREAGYCLVGSAEKDGLRLIAVVLGAASSQETYDQTKALLEYGFAKFERRRLVQRDIAYGSYSFPAGLKTRLMPAKELVATVERDSPLEKQVIIRKGISLPVRKGQILAKIKYRQGTRLLGEVNLKTDKAIAKPSLFEKARLFVWGLFRRSKKAQN